MITALFVRFVYALMGNVFIQLLLIAICADMVFGTLRAAKYRCWNSSIGIDGAIRKAGMVASVLLFTLMDMMVQVDLITWMPVSVRDILGTIGVIKMGVTELFCSLYIAYESISVLKNMLLCGVPIPKGIRAMLAKWLDSMTDETQVDVVMEMSKEAVLNARQTSDETHRAYDSHRQSDSAGEE